MEFYQTPGGRMGIKDIPPVLTDLLRQIPQCADAESEEVEARLYPAPSIAPGEDQLREDWKAHVEPELHTFFLSSRQVVEADLRGMKEDDIAGTIEFPFKHAEAWLNALNQARLALAAQHNLGEKELSHPGPMQILNERDLALLQINFYAAIQQWLVEALDF